MKNNSRLYISLFALSMFLSYGSSIAFAQPNNAFQVPPFFTNLDQTIPDETVKARDESMVAIRVLAFRLRMDQEIYQEQVSNGAGFAVLDGYVLTALHLLGDFPALWTNDNPNFPTVIEVFDGENIFKAKAVYFNHKADLLLLEVSSPNDGGLKFKKKPAKLVFETYSMDQNSKKPKALYDKFFAFSFFKNAPGFFFSLQLGSYYTVTNVVKEQMLANAMGILQTSVEPGFSGGPLWSPDGKVVGMVARSSNSYTYVVLIETINTFLELAQKQITKQP